MYKYWTPKFVNLTVLPKLFYWANSSGLPNISPLAYVMEPGYTVCDLDLASAAPSNLAALSAKGHKVFKMHEAARPFTAKYHNLDRLALQKQQKELFLTNGSWSAREQLRNPACIQLYMTDPNFINSAGASVPFADVVVEF